MTSRILVCAVGVALAACSNGGPGTGTPLIVSGDLTADTTWPKTGTSCDVVVTAVITVKANLTIAAGVTVCFDANTGLLVEQTGSLKAIGTANSRIAFTSTNGTPGAWKGLAFLSTNASNTLQYADVSYAGGADPFCCGFVVSNENIKAGVLVGDEGTSAILSVQNSTVSGSGAAGLFAFGGSRLPGFSSNRFFSNAGAAVAVSLAAAGDLDVVTVYGGGSATNGKNEVRVLKYEPTAIAVQMKKLDVPYAMSEGIADQVFELNAALTIDPGVRLEFEANTGLLVNATGQLTLAGTAASRVVLTGRSAVPGFWKGVAMLSAGNTLTSADLTFGGNDDSFCCGFFEPLPGSPATKATLVVGDGSTSGGATITDVHVSQSKNRGVAVLTGTLTQHGTNDLVTGNGLPNLL